ncbi:mucin-3A [Morone saxatilis]|uniref:mucin-3A n=1 Tax=Morone saxatilis TaxID=34816 RepID=UPI0015E25275|nr:mucin-3A [Morone saxatilis]
MEKYYLEKKIENFKEVVVTSVSRAVVRLSALMNIVERLSAEAMDFYSMTPRAEGVSVTHDVVLVIPNDVNSEQLYVNDFEAVEKAVAELTNCTEDCLYEITVQPIVNTTVADLGSICGSSVDNPDVAEYYEAVPVDGVIKCVTVCNHLHPHPKTCYNNGSCNVYMSIGPLCKCQNVNSTWYLSDDCSFPIQRTAFYAGLSVTLAFLLMSVGALTAYILINKHKQTQRRDIKKVTVNDWLNEDFNWSRSSNPSNRYHAGDYRNPSYTEEESAVGEECTDNRQPVPFYQLTRESSPSASMHSPSRTAHRHDSLLSDARNLQSAGWPQPDISEQPMRIGRPRIRTSWDA